MKKLLTTLTLIFSVATFAAIAQETKNEDIIANIDAYTQQVCKDWSIPGLSLAISKDGQTIFAKSYGVEDIKTQVPVTNESVYQIGSVSKSFTAGIMASLVDDGLVEWSDTVKNILPDFDLFDDWVENNITVDELMLHRTGIKGQAGTYIPNLGYNRDDIYQMLKYIKPAYSFRDVYAYNNITFIIAAKVIEKVTGKSWEENLQERILDPLGMTKTSANEEGFKSNPNATTPHSFYYDDGKMKVEPLYGEEQALHWLTVIGPAGSINSTATDLLKWAEFQRNLGKVGDKQIISTKNMKYLQKGQTIVSQGDDYIRLYGLCWFVEQNDEYKLFFHTGTTWGQTAICAFIPEHQLTLTVLVNSEASSSPRYAIMRRVIELYEGDASKDWNAEYLESWWKDNKASWDRSQAAEAKIVKVAAPKMRSLVGEYTKQAPFGDAKVFKKDGELYITIGRYGWTNKLVHKNGNDYNIRVQGSTLTATFNIEEGERKANSFDIDFNENENFGPWKRK